MATKRTERIMLRKDFLVAVVSIAKYLQDFFFLSGITSNPEQDSRVSLLGHRGGVCWGIVGFKVKMGP